RRRRGRASAHRVPRLELQAMTAGSETHPTTHTFHTGLGTMNDYGQPYYTEDVGGNIYVWRHTTRTFQGGFTPYIVGRLASVTVQENSAYNQPDGSTSSSWTYNLTTGFLTSQTVRGITTSFEPRPDGSVAAVVDARGNRTTFGYDWGVVNDVHTANTHTTSVITPEGLVGSQTQVGDQTTGNVTTTYGYDLALRLASIQPPSGNPTNIYPDD